ncbi:hypothetical protein HYV43_01845 [Candidatus Micrarchaeota archaeon]|nr:hypothetical protein [Candidatus Micrarchaeota archaeon]
MSLTVVMASVAVGLAGAFMQNIVNPLVAGFTKGDYFLAGIALALVGAAVLMFMGDHGIAKVAGQGAVVAGALVAFGPMVANLVGGFIPRAMASA